MTKLQSYTDKNIVSRAEFARLNNWQRGRVTQLANDGRLVLAENGKDVCVIESLARIQATRDLSKLETVERHAKAREQKKTAREIQLENELTQLQAAHEKLHREFVGWFGYSRKLDGGVYRFLEAIREPNEHTSELLAAIQRKDDDVLYRFIYSEFPIEDLYFDDDDDDDEPTSANDDDLIFADLHTPIE